MRRHRRGFTLIELMIVILIILLVSAVVLPQVLPALAHRQVTEAGRILQAGLVQARAEAVKANAPRGIRLLPDPTYANSATILAYNRWVPIEPGPDYANGQVVIWPVANFAQDGGNGAPNTPNFYPPPTPPPYTMGGGVWPYYAPSTPNTVSQWNPNSFGQVLMVEQAPLAGNNAGNPVQPAMPNNPTSWFWNIRVGDKIQIGDSGAKYTVVGPMVVNPLNGQNPEMFVNDGPPGQTSQLTRQYTDTTGQNTAQFPVEYLYVVNSQDDDSDGFVDGGWDGFNGNYNLATDDLLEWETEQWLGSVKAKAAFSSMSALLMSPYQWACANTVTQLMPPLNYTISRRPVVSPGARETALPTNVVIDATTWNSTHERSRLPIDPNSHYVDILLSPNGQAVLQTAYSSPASVGESATFMHCWLAEREEIHETGDLWGWASPGVPNANPTANPAYQPNPNQANYDPRQQLTFRLPMPAAAYSQPFNGTPIYSQAQAGSMPALKGERMLLTLFGRTGKVSTNAVESFNPISEQQPFFDSQLGGREAK